MRLIPVCFLVAPPSLADGACFTDDWIAELESITPSDSTEADRWPETLSLSIDSYGDGVDVGASVGYADLPLRTVSEPGKGGGCGGSDAGGCTHSLDDGAAPIFIGGDTTATETGTDGTITIAGDEATIAYEADGIAITVRYVRAQDG